MVFCDTSGAVIHYAIGGREPDATDPALSSGEVIPVTAGATYKLKAFRSDLEPSGVATATYTFKVGTPVFTPPPAAIKSNTLVSIDCETPGAVIYYTKNDSVPSTNSSLYTGPVALTGPVSLRAFAVADGYSDSSPGDGFYSQAQVSTPILDPASGSIPDGSLLSIKCDIPDAVIFYTVDGSEPTRSSQVYSEPFPISAGTTVKTFAAAEDYLDSPVRTGTYALAKAGTPMFTPPGGPVTNGTSILLAATEAGSVVRYTVDGSPVTSNSPIYTGPIIITNLVTITAAAFKPDLAPSDARVVSYGIIVPESTVVTTVAGGTGPGFTNGFGSLAKFSGPLGVTVDPMGVLYVADTLNNVVRRIRPGGEVDTYAGTGIPGFQDGTRMNAQFLQPRSVYADRFGRVFVSDNCSRLRVISTNGLVSTLATLSSGCGWQISGDSLGNLYAGSAFSVQTVSPEGVVSMVAGQGLCCADGWANRVGTAVGPNDSLFAASGNLVYEIANGNAYTNAGSGPGYSDGSKENCRFEDIGALAADLSTNVFVGDRRAIRKIYSDGRVTTFAGGGLSGYKDGRGSEARFGAIDGMCADPSGNVYVADSTNNCIRKISIDTGGIGIADDWRRQYFGTTAIEPSADSDNDGMSNYSEFWAGTNPLDSTSVLLIESVAVVTNNEARITWKSTPGKSYVIKHSSDFGSWIPLGPPVQGNGTELSVNDPWPVNLGKRRVYRVFLNF